MATLTETAFYSRRAIRWGIIGFIGFIILRILLGMLFNYLIQFLPPPQLKPNNAFGRLPALIFPQDASASAQLNFTLQTISGTIPEASTAARVFFMPKGRPNLLALSRSQSLVGKIGFTTTPRQITDNLYRWIDLNNPLRTLEMDIVNTQFRLRYLFANDLTLFAEKSVPSPQQATREAISFIDNLELEIPDIDVEHPKVQYLRLVGNQLEPTTSQSQADAVKLDFFRINYEGMPVLTDQPNEGNISFIFSGSRRQDRRILLAKYNYWPINTQSTGIYKLITGQQAWENLISGDAYFVFIPPNETQVVITNAYLGYYDGQGEQLFLQPIFVFEGEKGFLAYVQAVAPPWIE